MSSEQVTSQPFRWHYSEMNGGNFGIHGRTLFFFLVLVSIILVLTLLFIYARWACHCVPPSPPSPSPPPPATTSPSRLPRDPQHRPRSLDIATVNSMPIVLYKRSASSGGTGSRNEAECCICLEVFGDKEEVKMLPECRHCFHSECVNEWFTAESSCPLCRASLRVDSPV